MVSRWCGVWCGVFGNLQVTIKGCSFYLRGTSKGGDRWRRLKQHQDRRRRPRRQRGPLAASEVTAAAAAAAAVEVAGGDFDGDDDNVPLGEGAAEEAAGSPGGNGLAAYNCVVCTCAVF